WRRSKVGAAIGGGASQGVTAGGPRANTISYRLNTGPRMIVGTGIDVVEIGRIQQAMDRYGQRFLNRVFCPKEQAYCLRKRNAAESFAARFAAKEAAAKALGTGMSHGVSWLEIEVVREPSGRPTLQFHGRAAHFASRLGVSHAALSLTHSNELAM